MTRMFFDEIRTGIKINVTFKDNRKDSGAALTSLIFRNYRGNIHLLGKIRRYFEIRKNGSRKLEWKFSERQLERMMVFQQRWFLATTFEI